MFYVVLITIAMILVQVLTEKGLRPMLAVGWAATVLAPVWMYREFGGMRIDLPLAIAMFLLVCVLFHPSTRMPKRLVMADFLVVALVGVLVASRCQAFGWKPTIVAAAVLEWGAPYLLGRILFHSEEDISRLARVAVWACLILSVWSICESVLRVNPILELAGRESTLEQEHTYRLGFRRAEGPLTHPIFFGFLLTLLFPWSLQAAAEAKRGVGPRWRRFLPALHAGGVFFSLSRGPMIGLIVVVYTTALVLWKKRRGKLVFAGIVAAAALFGYRSLTMDALYAISGELQGRDVIFIKGDPYTYTGTSHRWLQFLVYRDAVKEAGLIGFGTMTPLGEAPHYQYVEEHLRERFVSIDNHYLYMTLRSGYLGVALFVLLGICSMYYFAMQARSAAAPHATLAAAAFSATLAGLIMMMTVWFPTDYGFYWITIMGMAAGWRAQAPSFAWLPAPQKDDVPAIATRRLVPGHPAI